MHSDTLERHTLIDVSATCLASVGDIKGPPVNGDLRPFAGLRLVLPNLLNFLWTGVPPTSQPLRHFVEVLKRLFVENLTIPS